MYRMPRPLYNDYTFYKIVNINGDVDLCYIGSTADMYQRNKCHKSDCNNPNKFNYNTKLYKTIREHGGWNEFKMVEIGKSEQITIREARMLEERYRTDLGANMNTIKCFVSDEEHKENKSVYNKNYRDLKKNELSEYKKQYHINNREALIEKNKKYKEEHKEELKAKRKIYLQENKIKLNAKRREAYQLKKEKKHTDLMSKL